MTDVKEISAAEKSFLNNYLPPHNKGEARDAGDSTLNATIQDSLRRNHGQRERHEFPSVTLTYAQSLDSSISLAPGTRTTLSGPETKGMTHYLRMQHDAILVGVGTAIPDDPGLNSRYPGATLERQPQPIIVDPRLRWNAEDSKVVQLAQSGAGKKPWIIHSVPKQADEDSLSAKCDYIYVAPEHLPMQPSDSKASRSSSRTIPWPSLLRVLNEHGVRSVMIEGGAAVISTLLSQPNLVDSLIVTIAPTWLGEGGVLVMPGARKDGNVKVNAARLKEIVWRQFGADAVLCGRLQS